MSQLFRRTPQACKSWYYSLVYLFLVQSVLIGKHTDEPAYSRRRKTKCDGVRPYCQGCKVRNIQCEWPGPDLSDGTSSPKDGRSGIGPSPDQPPSEHSTEVLDTFPTTSTPSSTIPAPKQVPVEALRVCLNLFFEKHFVTDLCSFDDRLDFEAKCIGNDFLTCSVVVLCGRYLSPTETQAVFGIPTASEVMQTFFPLARFYAKLSSDEPSGKFRQTSVIFTTDTLHYYVKIRLTQNPI